MKILLITSIFPTPYQGTHGVFNYHMMRSLARCHEVRVVTPISWVAEWVARRSGHPPLGPGRRTELGGIEVHYPRFYYTPKLFRFAYARFMWASVRGTIRELLGTFVPDVVVGYWEHPDGAVAVRVARSVGAAAVVIAGGTSVLLHSRNLFRRRSIASVLRSADAVVALSRDLRNKIIRLGVPPETVHVVYRDVDRGLFCPGAKDEARRWVGIAPGDHVLLWVGRMVPVKGLDVLLEALTRLRDRGFPARAYLIGDGPLRVWLERECQRRGLSARVHFVGIVSNMELPNWYRAADLTVLPSRSEGLPNVLRESIACGTPFVASRVGGVAELSDDPANRLVEPDDPEALSLTISACLRTPAALGPSPHVHRGVCEALTSLFDSLVSRGAGPEPGGVTVTGPPECGGGGWDGATLGTRTGPAGTTGVGGHAD